MTPLRLMWVYPDLLSTYGDRGNVLVLERRARLRGLPVEILEVNSDQPVPPDGDIYLMGGGEDLPQTLATRRLQADGGLREAAARGAVVFAVCAGYQMLGVEFGGADDAPVPGLGLLDIRSGRGERRAVGEIVADVDPALDVPRLTGFENHQGVTRLGPQARPLARTTLGTGNGDGTTVSGNISYNDLANISPQGGIAIASGTYTVEATGRVTLTGVSDNSTFAYNLELYLDGNGNARVLSMDSSDVVDGLANQQSGSLNASAFSGTYAMGVIGVDPNFFDEIDAVGPVVADGVGNFPGFVDLNWIFTPSPGPTFANESVSPATFAATSTPGIFTGNITGIDVTNCPVYNANGLGCTADLFTYYLVNSSTVVGIENDGNQQSLLRFELQH